MKTSGQFHDEPSLPLEGTPVPRLEMDKFREEKIYCPAAIRSPDTSAVASCYTDQVEEQRWMEIHFCS